MWSGCSPATAFSGDPSLLASQDNRVGDRLGDSFHIQKMVYVFLKNFFILNFKFILFYIYFILFIFYFIYL